MALSPHTVGVDLGQSRDFTSVAVLQQAYWLTAHHAWELGLPEVAGWVWPSQLPSPVAIDEARSRNYHEPDRIGRPPNPPLSLVHLDRHELHTPYPEIVERIGALLRTPPLRLEATPLVVDATGVGAPVVGIPRSLPIADLLTKELQEFRRTVTKVGTDAYAAERDRHDDMVLAIALAAWHREFINTHLEKACATIQQGRARVAEADGGGRFGRLASR